VSQSPIYLVSVSLKSRVGNNAHRYIANRDNRIQSTETYWKDLLSWDYFPKTLRAHYGKLMGRDHEFSYTKELCFQILIFKGFYKGIA